MNFSKTIASSSSLTIMKILLSFAVCTALFQPAGALPATHYADCSVLSSGTWVKVAVSQPAAVCGYAASMGFCRCLDGMRVREKRLYAARALFC